MPDLRGHTLDDAVQLLNRVRMQIGRVDSVRSDSTPGTITRQSVERGSPVRAGQSVDVSVAIRAPRRIEAVARVPSPALRTQLERAESLRRAGLPPGTPGPRDTLRILDTLPQRQGVAVPYLVGMSPRTARDTLRAVGLRLGPVDSLPDRRGAGVVVRQRPDSGVVVPFRTPVSIWYGYWARVQVPNLRDSTVAGATHILESVGLRLGSTRSLPTESRVGRVLAQQPLPDSSVDVGTTVSITVGVPDKTKVSGSAVVPHVVDSTLQRARDLLERRGLRSGPVHETESDRPAGVVVDQEPDSGSVVSPGSSVALWVTVPRRKVQVPDVIGQTPDSAALLIRGARLRMAGVDSSHDAQGRGRVVSQQPNARDSVPPGQGVTLHVTVPPVGVVVPDVVHRSLDAARSRLKRAGLILGSVEPLPREGGDSTVVSQDPAAGARRLPGSAVAVWIGVPSVVVPDVVGLDSVGAEHALASAGFRLSVAEPERSDRAAGTVVSQSPSGGTASIRGSDVTVHLAAVVHLVPPVVGFQAAAAESALGAAGLVSTRVDTAVGFGTHGVVLRQDPVGGSVATPGMVVEVYVGVWPVAWLWAAGLAGTLGLGAMASGPILRRLRDRRCRRRLEYKSVSVAGTHVLFESAEPLIQPDLQLDPKTSPGTYVLEVDGPLFLEDLP